MKHREIKYGLLLLGLLVVHQMLTAQDALPVKLKSETSLVPGYEIPPNSGASLFIVRNIFITGNKKTRPDIILRELPFKTGDQFLLQEIVKRFEQAREQLMNTALFHEVIVALKSFEGYNVDILVEVKERWYIFPIPYFRLLDRNFNEWLVEEKGSLDKVEYGLKLLYNNITGRNDKLRVWFVSGYTHQFSFDYDRLYIDKLLKWGMHVNFSVGNIKDVDYTTIGNKQVFIQVNDTYLQNFLNANIDLTYRRAIKTRHRFGFGYHVQNVNDTIVSLNPNYFPLGRSGIRYLELNYTMTYFDVDYIPYPTKGYAAEVFFSKKGFNNTFNEWLLTVKGSANWRLWPKTYFGLRSFGTVKLPLQQPFYNQSLLGYGDVFMQGYEYYVIDGVAGGYLKANIARELFSIHGNFLNKQKGEPLHIPVRVFAKIFGNAGYVYNPQAGDNFLNNRMLYSAGLGLDVITVYDFVLKLEFTFNSFGQNGLFLHRTSNF